MELEQDNASGSVTHQCLSLVANTVMKMKELKKNTAGNKGALLKYPQALVQEMAGKVVMDQHPAGLGLGLGLDLSQTMGG